MQEIWKDIPNYEGLYQASNLGRIKSLNKYHHKREQILKNKKTKDGYFETTLFKNGKNKCIRTHRLIAMAFIHNKDNKPQINHKDGNKLNNNVGNLEWCTIQENKEHAIRTGLQDFWGKKNPKAKAVNQYDKNGKFIKRYDTLRQAMYETGISESKISLVCNKHRKTAGGYIWVFVDKEVKHLCSQQ